MSSGAPWRALRAISARRITCGGRSHRCSPQYRPGMFWPPGPPTPALKAGSVCQWPNGEVQPRIPSRFLRFRSVPGGSARLLLDRTRGQVVRGNFLQDFFDAPLSCTYEGCLTCTRSFRGSCSTVIALDERHVHACERPVKGWPRGPRRSRSARACTRGREAATAARQGWQETRSRAHSPVRP